MNNSEWVLIVVFIVSLFFLNQFLNKRYLSKLDPDKVEGIRLILFAFLMGTFYAKALESSGGLIFTILLAILTVSFVYRFYKWIKGAWYHKEQEG